MTDTTDEIEAILAKAERFLGRANYPLAKVEFDKAARRLGPGKLPDFPDITAKLTLCRQQIDLQKAKELTKKAKRLLDKKNSAEAIRCYEQALALHPDARLAERLEALRADRCGQDAAQAAHAAEVAGDFGRAAQIYGEASATNHDPDLQLAQARCLVKAGTYQQAIAILASLDHSLPAVCYDHGFALVQQGRYCAGLQVWDGIRSTDEGFLRQRASVQARLAADLIERWGCGQGLPAIYDEGGYLLASGDRQALPPELAQVVEHCRAAKIAELWGQGRFADIASLLLPFGASMPPSLCVLAAKAFFQLAEESGRYLPELGLCWLTALLVPTAFPLAEADGGHDKTRAELILRVERLLTRLAEAGDPLAQQELSAWAIDRRVIETLQSLVQGDQCPAPLICTPRFARRFGHGEEMLALMRDRHHLLASHEEYLEIGSLFTEASTSLYLLAAGDYEGALRELPAQGQPDELSQYARLKVNVLCGGHHIETKRGKPGRFFIGAHTLFALAPRYEEDLCRQAMQKTHDLQVLEGYGGVLDQLYRERPSAIIAEALSLVMTTQALLMGRGGKSNGKALEAIVSKAVRLNPDNELARLTLTDIRDDIAIKEMLQAISYGRMAKAFKIVQDAASDTVRESYFTALEHIAEDMDEFSSFTPEEKVFALREVREWCAKMDDGHPLLKRIEAKLTALGYRSPKR